MIEIWQTNVLGMRRVGGLIGRRGGGSIATEGINYTLERVGRSQALQVLFKVQSTDVPGDTRATQNEGTC